MSLFSLANNANSIITTCSTHHDDCVSNMIPSIILFILTALWFGCVWILGSAAQERRSKRLAQLLMATEAFIVLIAVFNVKHHIDALSAVTSILDICLAIWIITLAFRLMRAGGGRIVSGQARRHRVAPKE